MTIARSAHSWLTSTLLLALMAGCGGVDLPDRAKVTGKVTLDGNPVTIGTVTFMPDPGKGGAGPSAVGEIDAQGNYSLTTDLTGRGGDGAVLGFHKVRVVSREKVEPGAPSKSLVPELYGDFSRTPLTAEVQPEKENVINLELTARNQGARP